MATKINKGIDKMDIAYQSIRNKIFNHILPPGAIISELKLSKEIKISRTTIRNALNRLENEGIITTINKRKRVSIIDIKEIEEIFDLKILLECMVAKKTTEKINEKQKIELSAIINDFQSLKDRMLSNNTPLNEIVKEYHRIDDLFHITLIDIAGNRRAKEIIQNLNLQWCQKKTGILAVEGHMHISINEHIEIGKAIIEKDCALAEQLVNRHLSKLKESLIYLTKAFNYPISNQ